MNKKKEKTRIKHRKNQGRVKKILQVSMLKAKPKRIIVPTKVELEVDDKKLVKKTPVKKDGAKKVPAKKTTAKKTTAKKTTAKKTTAKKTTAKKTTAKKTTAKKTTK